MASIFGLGFLILGYAIMALASPACFFYGVVTMVTDGFWTGLAMATAGSLVTFGIGLIVMLVGATMLEAA